MATTYRKPSLLQKIGAPDDERYMTRIGELLTFHGLLPAATALGKHNFIDAVASFQEKQGGLMVDGDPGIETLWALQLPWAEKGVKLKRVKSPADQAPGSGGYKVMELREDAAAAWEALRNRLNAQGALITSAGGFRPLASAPNASQSATSLHYPGLAFDLATDGGSGYANPVKDAFVIVAPKWEIGMRWRLYARATQGIPMTLEGRYWGGAQVPDPVKSVTGKFVDFTALAASHGFHPIGPRSAFFRTGQTADGKPARSYMSAEWWHFQYETALIPGLSQLGIEILRVAGNTAASVPGANAALWEKRKATFGFDWR